MIELIARPIIIDSEQAYGSWHHAYKIPFGEREGDKVTFDQEFRYTFLHDDRGEVDDRDVATIIYLFKLSLDAHYGEECYTIWTPWEMRGFRA